MIVKDNRNQNYTMFKHVNVGELFFYDNKYYMRVLSSRIPYNCGKYNAIDIESGDFIHITLEENVIQLEGEIIVR